MTAALFASQAYYKQLERFELLLGETGGHFLTGENINLADCIAFATLEFAEGAYGVFLSTELEKLSLWYDAFKLRSSTVCPPYPEDFLKKAYGLPEHSQCWYH